MRQVPFNSRPSDGTREFFSELAFIRGNLPFWLRSCCAVVSVVYCLFLFVRPPPGSHVGWEIGLRNQHALIRLIPP